MLSAKDLGPDVVSSLITFKLSVRPGLTGYPDPPFFFELACLSQSTVLFFPRPLSRDCSS